MKKLQLHIALFLLPLVLLIALLPVNQRLKYNGLWFDCLQQGDLVYNRLYQNPKPVDVLFLGTDTAGNTLRVGVKGDRDPGYGSTSKMITEAAVCLLQDASAEAPPLRR